MRQIGGNDSTPRGAFNESSPDGMMQMNQGLYRWRDARGPITAAELRAMQGEPIPPDVQTISATDGRVTHVTGVADIYSAVMRPIDAPLSRPATITAITDAEIYAALSASEAAFRAEAPLPDNLHNALYIPHPAGTCAHCDSYRPKEEAQNG